MKQTAFQTLNFLILNHFGVLVVLKNNVTALILCGGKGERLRPLTASIPKPLIHINGHPILGYLLDYLKKYNLKDIVVASGYQAEKIELFFQQEYNELNVNIVDSGNVDILDRIKSCAPYIKGDFIVFYGDTLANVKLDVLQKYHYQHNKKITMTLWPLKSQFGLVKLDDDDNVINFREKPILDEWINIGNFYYEQNVFPLMKDISTYAEFLISMGGKEEIKGYKHEGVHITINTLRELEDAEQNINKFK